MISHSCPDLGRQEEIAVLDVLRSLHIKSGEVCKRLERRIAHSQGFKYGLSTATGGHAIELALRLIFDKGGRVGIPSYLCRSVYDAVVRANCTPVLLDIEPRHFGPAIESVRQQDMDVVIIAHLFGVHVPLEPYLKTGVPIIEDCAQLVTPSTSEGQCRGVMRMLSFEATKLLTCGEGGMLLLDDEIMYNKGLQIRDGLYDTEQTALWSPLTDIQAAIVGVQWDRLDEFLHRRKTIGLSFLRAIGASFRGSIHPSMYFDDTLFFRFILTVNDVLRFIQMGDAAGVTFRKPIAPKSLERLFKNSDNFYQTEKIMKSAVSIPIYPALKNGDVEKVIEATLQALKVIQQ